MSGIKIEIVSSEQQFVSVARGELHRIEELLAKMPMLEQRRAALMQVLQVYGVPILPLDGAAPSRRSVDEKLAQSIAKIDAPKPDSRESAPKPRGSDPVPRPPGIPSTYDMVREILRDNPTARYSMVTLCDAVCDKWWPGMQRQQIRPDFYRFRDKGLIEVDAVGLITLTQKGLWHTPNNGGVGSNPKMLASLKTDPPLIAESLSLSGDDDAMQMEPPKAPHRDMPPPAPIARATPEPVKASAPPKPAAAPQPRVSLPPPPPPPSAETKDFDHNGKTARLLVREWRIVTKLMLCFESGFMPYQNIFVAAYGGDRPRGMDPALWLSGTVPIINEKLAPLRLKINHVPKQGYSIGSVR